MGFTKILSGRCSAPYTKEGGAPADRPPARIALIVAKHTTIRWLFFDQDHSAHSADGLR